MNLTTITILYINDIQLVRKKNNKIQLLLLITTTTTR